MKTIQEFSATATAEQAMTLINACHRQFPSFWCYGGWCNWTDSGLDVQIGFRDAEVKSTNPCEVILLLCRRMLIPAVLERKKGVPKIVAFFRDELGWPVRTLADLQERFLGEAIAG